MLSEEYRYNAFISYRRTPHDTAVAREVQHSLEHFRIPADIRRQTGVERIDRIFRDQEELEITPDLSGRIEQALAESEYLIVICSPEYSQSPWCLQELRTFIRLRGAEHVLCVLSNGEPPSVFPQELLKRTREVSTEVSTAVTLEETVEPMACDYRGSVRHARRTELPRLAAAMLRCSYDDLVMRRERYRRRRLTAAIAAASLAASVAIAYLLWSNAQISKNYRQALISESRLLASESLKAYENQDRLAALQYGLQALVGGDPDRPVTDEALFSLSQATYSYTTPFTMLETWRIDLNHRITEWFISRDGQILVCMDQTGEFSCYEMASGKRISCFRVVENAVPSAPVEGMNGEFFCYAGGEVFSVDYRSGEINWREEMNYGVQGSVQLSPDGRYLAAADSFAVWIMTTDDVPHAGYRLPDSADSFITDLRWSPDGSRIAVKLKRSGTGRESAGMFDVETGVFTRLDCEYTRLDLFRFDEDNILYLLGDNRFGYSTDYDGVTTLVTIPYELRAYRSGELLWHQEIAEQTLTDVSDLQVLHVEHNSGDSVSASGDGNEAVAPSAQKQIYFSLGDKVYVLDEHGMPIFYLETHRDLIRLLSITADTVTFVTADGDRGTGWPGGGSIMTKTFPSGLERIEVTVGKNHERERFVAQVSGDLYVYEDVSDENIHLIEGNGFQYRPDGFLRDGNLAVLLTNGTVYVYDLETHIQLAVTPLPEGDAWRLLTVLGGKAYLLRIHGEEGKHSVLCLEMASGEITGEIPLPTGDYLVRTGITQTPLTREDALYTAFLYQTPSPAAVCGEYLYIHDERSETVFQLHLPTGSLSELQFLLPEVLSSCSLVSYESGYPMASPLVISPDGKTLFTVATDPSDGRCGALLADLEEKSVTVLPGEPQDLSSVVFTGSSEGIIDTVLYSGSHELYICNTDGEEIMRIPWTGDKPLSFSANDGKVYCIFRDSTMRVYQDGEQVGSIPLTFTLEQAVISGRDFRYEFQGQMLYLYCGADLNVISLGGEGTTPVYAASSVLERTENGELILFSWPPESRDLFSAAFNSVTETVSDSRFFLAYIPEYGSEELLLRAQEQINHYVPYS